jgi:hypothetical protein
MTIFSSDSYKRFIFEEVCENGASYTDQNLNGSAYDWENGNNCVNGTVQAIAVTSLL